MVLSDWYLARIAADISGLNTIAEMAASIQALRAGFEELAQSVKFSDEIRDLDLSLQALTKTTETSLDALDRFRASSLQTRDTFEALGEAYRKILPLGQERGFSAEALQSITELLSKLGTISGDGLDRMVAGFERILTGAQIRGTNPILEATGITSKEIKEMSFPELIQKIQETIDNFDKFGQSASSSFAHVKTAWEDAFGAGFHEAMGRSQEAYQNIQDELRQPAVIDAFENIGKAVGHLITWFGGLQDTIKTWAETWTTSLSKIRSEIEIFLNDPILIKLENYLKNKTQDTPQNPTWESQNLDFSQETADYYWKYRDAVGKVAGRQSFGDMAATGLVATFLPGVGEYMAYKTFMAQVDKEAMKAAATLPNYQIGDTFTSVSAGAGYMGMGAGDIKITGDAYADAHSKMKGVPDTLVSIAEASRKAAEAQRELNKEIKEFADRMGWRLDVNAPLIISDKAIIETIKKWVASPLQTLVDPSLDSATLDMAKNMAIGRAQGDILSQQFEKQGVQYITDPIDPKTYQKSLQMAREMSATFVATIRPGMVDMFQALAEDGGSGFGRAALNLLNKESSDSLLKIFSHLPVPMYDKATGQFIGFGSGGQLSSDQGLAKAEYAASQGLVIAGAGYGAGLSGAPGSRTGAVLEGAVTGATTGMELFSAAGPIAGVYGAIVGAVVGLIGAAIGAAQRQADYQYGIPTIIDGKATLSNDKNLTQATIAQMDAQVQTEYDLIHDSMLNMILKFPTLAIPDPQNIIGKFQDNPSAHFAEHFQLYVTQTLPREIMGQFEDELIKGFETFGMSPDAFKKIWDHLQGLDPNTAVQDLSNLVDAMSTLFDPNKGLLSFFHGGTGDLVSGFGSGTFPGTIPSSVFGPGSQTYGMYTQTLINQSLSSPGTLINQNMGDIIKLGQALMTGGLSPEAQIKDLQQLTALMNSRYDAEKQAIQDLFNLAQNVTKQVQAANQNFVLMGMVKADGTPDYAAQSKYFSDMLGSDLGAVQNAKNTGQLNDAWTKFMNDLNQATSLGIQAGGDPKAWSQWAQGVLAQAQQVFNSAVASIGQSINAANDIFNNQLDPALLAFLKGLTDVTGTPGTGGGGPGDDTGGGRGHRVGIYGLGDAAGAAGNNLDSVSISSNSLKSALDDLVTSVDNLNAALGNQATANSIVSSRYVRS